MELKISLVSIVLVAVKGCSATGEHPVDARSAFDEDLYESVLDPAQCQRQLQYLTNSSLSLRFLDASAKLPSGVMSGNINDLGDYWQCLGINELIDDMQFQGKYCAILAPLNQNPIQLPTVPDLPDIIWPPVDNGTDTTVLRYEALRRHVLAVAGFGEPVDMRGAPAAMSSALIAKLGVCVPHVCTAREAVDFLQQQIPFLNFTFNEYYCRLPNDKPFSGADYTAMVVLGILACALIFSTSYDLYCCFVLKDPKAAIVLLRCFSVYTNTRRFLSFNSVPGAIDCIDGIRAISMMWVVVGHTFVFTLFGYIHNFQDILNWLTKFSSTWINSAPITVDTFFLLSGILCVYTTVDKISKGRFIRGLHLFYLNRLLRMFPLLAMIVLLQAGLLNHVSDGPYWINMSLQAETCRRWWWSALLHVQNYVNPTAMCIPQSWYLAVDVQLYFFCPIIMVWLFGSQLYAWIALCTIVVLSLVSSTVYSFTYNFSAALANPARLTEMGNYSSTYYFNTLTRAAPFFVGMMYGYLLHLCRNTRIRISRLNVIILWSLSFVMMSFCIFSIYPVMQPQHQGQVFDNFLNAYMRAIWACALGWLIFACVHGYGGPINWFLSLPMWKLPARLSFAMYLVHVSIMTIANSSWTKTYYFTEGHTIYRFMSDITLTFIAAFILCITVDAPFSTLQKLLMGGVRKSSQKERTDSQNNIIDIDVESKSKTKPLHNI